MSRYIDAKWLQESLELADECKDCKRNVDKCVYANIDVGVVCNAVDDAPSIDIVFCKECRHWYRAIDESGIEHFNFSRCTKGRGGNGLEFYCADGERREP